MTPEQRREWRARLRWLMDNRSVVAERGKKLLEAGASARAMLEKIAAEFGYEERDVSCLASGIARLFLQRRGETTERRA